VPRFHVTWGTGPGVVEPFERRVRAAVAAGKIKWLFRHRVDELEMTNGRVTGVTGSVLAPSTVARGKPSSREIVGSFRVSADAVIVASGGIGGNAEMVRRNWPNRLGSPPRRMVRGVPDHVDGRMLDIAMKSGANNINRDRMWHYVEGLQNWDPIWTDHGIRILPGPSSFWIDAKGNRLPPPLYPGFDTLGSLEHIMKTGYEHSWFVLNKTIIAKEFALSGSEQNPDLTGKSWRGVLGRIGKGVPEPVQAFMDKGADLVVEAKISDLVRRMNALVGEELIDAGDLERQIKARDAQIDNPFCKDGQIMAIQRARTYLGDKLVRTARPHKILDPAAGPLIAARLNILTRKTLGGLQTDLSARVLKADGSVLPGLYAVGEVSGFGGGGVHGYRALEGTFLGGCIFTGRVAGRAAAEAMAG
jgi:hypothetical protein